MDPITLTILATGIVGTSIAAALAKGRKPALTSADLVVRNVAADIGAAEGAKVVQKEAPKAETAQQQEVVAQDGVEAAVSAAAIAVPVVAAVVVAVTIYKGLVSARKKRSAKLRNYWPLFSWAQQSDWLHKKAMSKRGSRLGRIKWHRRVKKLEKGLINWAIYKIGKGKASVKGRLDKNMLNKRWRDTFPANFKPSPVFTTSPSYMTKQKAKQEQLIREAATEAATKTLQQVQTLAGFSFA